MNNEIYSRTIEKNKNYFNSGLYLNIVKFKFLLLNRDKSSILWDNFHFIKGEEIELDSFYILKDL